MPDSENASPQGNSRQQFYGMPRESPFEETFLPHLDAAYNLARWILGKEEDAQDVVQEAYAPGMEKLLEVSRRKSSRLALAIVHNTAVTWIKRYVRPRNLSRLMSPLTRF